MLFMAKYRIATILLVVAAALPAAGQHVAGQTGNAAGRGGSVAARPSFSFSGARPASRPSAMSGMARPAYIPPPHFGPGRYQADTQNFMGSRSGFRHHDFDRRRDFHNGRYGNQFAPSYGAGFVPWSGWSLVPGPDLLDYPDTGFYDQPSPMPVDPPQADPTAGYPPQQAFDTQPARQQPVEAPASTYRQPYVRQAPQPEPQLQDAVTLVFKDGRPSEQIRNYMLTQTKLYVQDGRLRVIPLDQIDVAATQKANQDAGVDFQIPGQS